MVAVIGSCYRPLSGAPGSYTTSPTAPGVRGPCRSLPKQTVTGFPLFGEGGRGCLLN